MSLIENSEFENLYKILDRNIDFSSEDIENIYNFIESLKIKDFKKLYNLLNQSIKANEKIFKETLFSIKNILEFCKNRLNPTITLKLQFELIENPSLLNLIQDIFLDKFLEENK